MTNAYQPNLCLLNLSLLNERPTLIQQSNLRYRWEFSNNSSLYANLTYGHSTLKRSLNPQTLSQIQRTLLKPKQRLPEPNKRLLKPNERLLNLTFT